MMKQILLAAIAAIMGAAAFAAGTVSTDTVKNGEAFAVNVSAPEGDVIWYQQILSPLGSMICRSISVLPLC